MCSPLPSFSWRGSALGFMLPWARRFSSLPPHIELAMPALSPTMSQGNLVAWKVKEGQAVAPGDELAEVETDKATLGWENQDEGFIAKLLVPEGTKDIPIGSPVALLVEEEDQVAAFKDYVPQQAPSAGGAAAAAAPAASPEGAEPAGSPGVEANVRIGPAARVLLEENHLPPSAVTPTGPHHIITKGDVLAAVAAGVTGAQAPKPAPKAQPTSSTAPAAAPQKKQPAAAAAPPPPPPASPDGGYTDIPTSQVRKIIAKRLLESKTTVPHLYVSADVELDGVAKLREALKAQGTKISVNDCVVKAAALALAQVPAANALWDAATEAPVAAPGVDISIAVATEGGLITPIVRGADAKSLTAIASEVRELAGRARANRLKPEEFQGGSFSISNLGMFGIDSFSAIINPPQACIMAVGGARKVARMGPGGSPVVATVMSVTLSADNRVYDGAVASDFLEAFSAIMANPYRLLSA